VAFSRVARSKAPMAPGSLLKRLLIGRTLSRFDFRHTLLPKVLALPVFSSDPLSSNAYATQEIVLVLGLVGAGALSLVIPISIAVAFLLGTVVVSYRQTVRAYPSGGGAYIVAHDNLGTYPGLLAGAALLIDYVLTVSVSISAGVDAIVSAASHLLGSRIPLALGLVGFVTLINLRGTKESGTLFAIPTYGFVISVYALLITGFVKCLDGCPQAESSGMHLEAEHALTAFLVLKAFSAGTTALTGVEAISNGVPAFRHPSSKNAATTLAMMGAMSISMFLGISLLANHTGVVFTEESTRTVLAQIAGAVFGGGPMFYVLQAMTAGILILAANTAYQDFPRLASILAQDRFMPRHFLQLGDRLVFSNGILVLAVLASGLIMAFDGNLNRLIQLYLVGVFISFTLSQGGMVRYWKKNKSPGWRRRVAINGFGALVTGFVFCVVVTTKFLGGAWMVVAAIPVIILAMRGVNRHYTWINKELSSPPQGDAHDGRPWRARANKVVILASPVPSATVKALAFARTFTPQDLRVVAFDLRERDIREMRRRWKELDMGVPIEATGHRLGDLIQYLRGFEPTDSEPVTLVIPEPHDVRHRFRQLARSGRMLPIKFLLLFEPGIVVASVPFRADLDPEPERFRIFQRMSVILLVSGVHGAVKRALDYAESLHPSEIKALMVAFEPGEVHRVAESWAAAGIKVPLEMVDSPFRSLVAPLFKAIDDLKPSSTDAVAVIIPEFVVPHWWQQLLHLQTALLIKAALLFRPNVIVISVPYRLGTRPAHGSHEPLVSEIAE
jgi:amino acid transporter